MPAPNRYPFPMPFGWFSVGYAEDFPAGRGQGDLLLRPAPRGLARRDRRGARAGRVLPAPRRPPRPRRHGRGLRAALPVPRLEVRRRGRQHRHPLQRPDEPQGPAAHLPGGRAQRLRARLVPPARRAAVVGRRGGRRARTPASSAARSAPTTWSTPACRRWARTRPTPPTSATCTTPRPCPRSSTTRPTGTARS